MKKRIGIVSYNIYCNFTNYGSALQSWALCQSIKKIAGNIVEPVLVDYCPEILADKDPLNPFANMWDKDEESRRMCELTMPAIRENYYKFDRFITKDLRGQARDIQHRILTGFAKMRRFQVLCVEAIRSFARMSSDLMMATMQIMSA